MKVLTLIDTGRLKPDASRAERLSMLISHDAENEESPMEQEIEPQIEEPEDESEDCDHEEVGHLQSGLDDMLETVRDSIPEGTWDLFTFVGGANDHYGDLNSLISSSRKKAGGDFTVIHCSGATSNWQPQIDPAMLHFRLQLVNRYGARLRSARPFNQEDFFVRVHLVFTAEKKQLFVLCAIIGCGSMKSGIPKYWRFTDAVGTEHDAADQGIPLTNAGRWRSRSTLSYLQQEGLGTVPADIQDEIAELVDNLPSKREDESQRSSSTWRRKFHASAPESEPPAHRRPGYPPTTYDQQPTGATASSSGTKPPPPPPPPAPKRSSPTTGKWLGLTNQQVGQRSSNFRNALMAQLSSSSPVPHQDSSAGASSSTTPRTQPAAPFLQPMAIAASQEKPAVPLMADSAPASLPATTPTPPAKPVVSASQIVDSRPAAPSAPSNPSPQDDSMVTPSEDGSSELKRPHDAASPDNDTPSKKTLSDAPATPSDSSAVRTEQARLSALAQENQIKTAVATTRQAEAVKTMQETLQELQTLRTEYEDIRRRLDALKGEESVGSAAFSADSSHTGP